MSLLGGFEQAANSVDKNSKKLQEHYITGNSYAGADSYKHKVVTSMKSVRIVPRLASDAVRWHEDKYAQQQHYFLFASYDLKIEIIRLFFHLEY